MAGETIPLCQKYNPDKLEFPVALSKKLDGVPIRLDMEYDPVLDTILIEWFTRNGESPTSVKADLTVFAADNHKLVKEYGAITCVFEVTHPDFPDFKDVSGLVRRDSRAYGLQYNLFDVAEAGYWKAPWYVRQLLANHLSYPELIRGSKFTLVHQQLVMCQPNLDAILEQPIPDGQEGWIIRNRDAHFKPGTRHWDYQKVVKEPMIDLRVVGFEEGVGKNAGGVGKVLVQYKDIVVGVGAGKMSYKDRQYIWDNRALYVGCICQVKYKPDDSYTALRQPTFQCWRHDKKEPDA